MTADQSPHVVPVERRERRKLVRPRPRRFHIDRRADAVIAEGAHVDDDVLLSTPEVADWFGVTDQWLILLRQRGQGPRYIKLHKTCIRYKKSDIVAWLDERASASTRAA